MCDGSTQDTDRHAWCVCVFSYTEVAQDFCWCRSQKEQGAPAAFDQRACCVCVAREGGQLEPSWRSRGRSSCTGAVPRRPAYHGHGPFIRHRGAATTAPAEESRRRARELTIAPRWRAAHASGTSSPFLPPASRHRHTQLSSETDDRVGRALAHTARGRTEAPDEMDDNEVNETRSRQRLQPLPEARRLEEPSPSAGNSARRRHRHIAMPSDARATKTRKSTSTARWIGQHLSSTPTAEDGQRRTRQSNAEASVAHESGLAITGSVPCRFADHGQGFSYEPRVLPTTVAADDERQERRSQGTPDSGAPGQWTMCLHTVPSFLQKCSAALDRVSRRRRRRMHSDERVRLRDDAKLASERTRIERALSELHLGRATDARLVGRVIKGARGV